MAGKGKRVRVGKGLGWDGWPYLAVLLICCCAGALGGFLWAVLGERGAELGVYLREYFARVAQGELETSFFTVLWDVIRWPLAVFIFGFTSLGAVAIPGLLLVRGFLLSYACASFGALLGMEGAAAAAAVFGVTALLALPALLAVGCEGLRTSCLRLSAGGGGRYRYGALLPVLGLLLLAAALQWTVAPLLIARICARFFS